MADERLSDERLAQIRHRLSLADHARYAPNASLEGTRIADLYRRDVSALLAEVERLRAREAAMRPIVEMVATGGVITTGNANTSITGPVLLNAFADLPALHEQAKAWLASQPPSPDDA